MSGIRSGSQCQAVARPGLKPCSEVSLHPPTLPCLCACLGAPTVSTLTPGVRGWWGPSLLHLLAMFCCLPCLLPVVAASGELEAPTSEGLAECPPDPLLQFQEEERPLNWGSP